MILIRYEEITPSKGAVRFIHYQPDLLTEDEKKDGVLLDGSVPEPDLIDGKESNLYYNPLTNELFFEYIDTSNKEEKDILLRKIELMQKALDELILGGAL